MKQIVHGGDIYSKIAELAAEKKGTSAMGAEEKGAEAAGLKNQAILDFSANINPLGLPDSVARAVMEGVKDCIHYPDPLCRDLAVSVADYEGVQAEQLLFGNGAADLIFRLVVWKMPYKAVVLAPTFAEYEASLESVGALVEHHFLYEESGFLLGEDILPRLKDNVDMLFLCNPNNPTGQLIEPELLRTILDRCKERDILLVLDECFMDFVEKPEEHSLKPLISRYDNLVILRAFTKNFAMPGLRLGYGISGNSKLLDGLSAIGQPWAVSLLAQLAGVQATKEGAYLLAARTLVFQEREYLEKALTELGFGTFSPQANYVFFKLKEYGAYNRHTFRAKLSKKGILIRSCGNYRGLSEEFFRIAVKTHEENKRLIEAIKEL